MDALALELGPRVDDLVDVARAAGETRASRSTIHRWVAQGFVSRPRQQQRTWRYPNVAIGEADTVARLRALKVPLVFFPFALYIETGSGDPEVARAFTLEFLQAWKRSLAEEVRRLRHDPDALDAEAEHQARKRGRTAPLPHRVRLPLDARKAAMRYTIGNLVCAQASEEEEERGRRALERAVGLRSGRGGATRDLSAFTIGPKDWPTDPDALASAVEAASADRLEFARRALELGVVWFPAVRSLFAELHGAAASVPLIDVIGDWEANVTPDTYVLLFAIGLRNSREQVPDDQIRELLKSFRPELVAPLILEGRTANEVALARRRLRPYQRLQLDRTSRGLFAS